MGPRIWRSTRLIFLVAVLLALVVGCGAPQEGPTPSLAAGAAATAEGAATAYVAAYPLAATAWDLAYFGSPEQQVPVVPNSRASVAYFWDRYAGYDGCSWFMGIYSASADGKIIMHAPARTLYANVCGPQDVYEQSARFTSSLQNSTEYRVEGGQLIADAVADQRLLTFNPAKVVPMLGTEWRLAFWWQADLRQFNPVIPGTTTTITFAQGGQASGSGGCSSYSVGYTGDLQVEKAMEATDTYAELPTLTFGPIAAQLITCATPEGIMDQEQGYFAALPSVAYYFRLGGMLMLLDGQGTPLLLFSANN